MKKTPWFPMIVKPVWVGVYEFRYGSGRIRRRIWDGANWRIDKGGRPVVPLSFDTWRGLAEPPK